jgi:hypothetical protein
MTRRGIALQCDNYSNVVRKRTGWKSEAKGEIESDGNFQPHDKDPSEVADRCSRVLRVIDKILMHEAPQADMLEEVESRLIGICNSFKSEEHEDSAAPPGGQLLIREEKRRGIARLQ